MFRFIPTSTTGVKTTFNKFSRTLSPGLNFYVPFLQKIHIVSNRLEQDTFKFEVKTDDNIFCKLAISIQYRIKPENTEVAFYSMDSPIDQMNSYIESTILNVSSSMTMNELFKSRNAICQDVSKTLSSKMEQYGYTIENTLVTEISPDTKVKESLNNIEAAKRSKEAAKEYADAAYITAVREAEADRDRKILQGQGISGQRLAILQGYETSVDTMAEKFGMNPELIIKFVLETQHMDTIEAIGKSNNTKTIFVNHGVGHVSKQLMEANENLSKE